MNSGDVFTQRKQPKDEAYPGSVLGGKILTKKLSYSTVDGRNPACTGFYLRNPMEKCDDFSISKGSQQLDFFASAAVFRHQHQEAQRKDPRRLVEI